MIFFWDADTGKSIHMPNVSHTDHIMSVAFSPNGSKIISGSLDERICIWDANTSKSISELIDGPDIITVAFLPTGGKIT